MADKGQRIKAQGKRLKDDGQRINEKNCPLLPENPGTHLDLQRLYLKDEIATYKKSFFKKNNNKFR